MATFPGVVDIQNLKYCFFFIFYDMQKASLSFFSSHGLSWLWPAKKSLIYAFCAQNIEKWCFRRPKCNSTICCVKSFLCRTEKRFHCFLDFWLRRIGLVSILCLKAYQLSRNISCRSHLWWRTVEGRVNPHLEKKMLNSFLRKINAVVQLEFYHA